MLAGYDKLQKIAREIIKPEECNRQIINYVADLNSNIENQLLQNAKTYGRYLPFIKLLGEQSLTQCAEGLANLIKYLNDSQKWYKFLLNLYERLSEYNIQKDTSACKHLANEITVGYDNMKVTNIKLQPFLNKCYPKYEYEYDNIKDMIVGRLKLNSLKKILKLTLDYSLDISCEFKKLVIKGQYVKLSDVKNSDCKQPKFIEVFSLNRVFIDTDLIKTGKEVQISIIAPIWDIQGFHEIVLDGSPGKSHYPVKAQSGIYPGTDGEDGKPGLPGGPGGNFLGVGAKFINANNLIISANGGKGGYGQHGGHGANGKDGEKFPNNVPLKSVENVLKRGNWKYIKENPIKIITIFYNLIREHYTVYGESGSMGGNGGNGGRGGNGGYSGHIFIEAFNNTKPITIKHVGEAGLFGGGGFPGWKGKNGDDLIVKYHSTWVLFIPFDYIYETEYITNYSYIHSAKVGITDYNDIDMKPSETIKFHNPSHTINDYKKYLREKLSGSVQESSLRDFLNKLENGPNSIDILYDISGLLNDLYGLESQFYKLYNKIPFLPSYWSLLNRVDYYIENKQNYLQDYNVLRYLRIASFSKICSISNNLENYLVIDVHRYFTSVKEHIKVYNQKLKEIKIDTYQNAYQKTINTQITEAHTIMKQTVLPEIDKIYDKVDSQIEKLIMEVIKNQKETEEKRQKLIEQQNDLSRQLLLRSVSGHLKILSLFLSFAGPVGGVISGAIGVGSSIIDSTLDHTMTPVINSAQEYLAQVTNYYKHEQKLLKENLNKAKLLQNVKSENKEELQVIFEKIKPLEKSLNQNSVDQNDYFDEKKRTKEDLQKYYEELIKNENSENEQNVKSKKEIVSSFQNAIKMAEVGLNLFAGYQESKSKISGLNDAIQGVSEKIAELKEYEHMIYKTMIPMWTDFQKTMSGMGQQLKNMSHVTLDVSKWKIQNTIKDFKMHMEYMVQVSDQTIKSQLMACIDKLQWGMLTMVKIYDRIQDYYDNAKLSGYIADLHSQVKITDDPELTKDIDQLEVMIQSNLILQEYEKGINAFKQYIFPFSDIYLEIFEMSPYFQSTNVSDLVDNAAKQIDYLRDQVTKEATTIKEHNYHIFPDIRFDHENVEKSPFYIWNHDAHGEEIAKLLLGQEIIMKADITRGIEQNAIKFKEIGIRFKLADKTKQSELDEQLSDYLVNITHLGDSHYRCDNMYYIITHRPVRMKHSVNTEYETDKKPHYYNENEIVVQIKKNPPMWSPYATWKIKLFHKDGKSFHTLRKYMNEVKDLALEGHGSYTDLGLHVCNKALEKYYEPAGTVLTINNVHTADNHRERRNIKNEGMTTIDNNVNMSTHSSDDVIIMSSSSASSSLKPIVFSVISWIRKNILSM